MSKFCGRCGSLLDANGKCSVCIDNHVVKEKNKVVKNKRNDYRFGSCNLRIRLF